MTDWFECCRDCKEPKRFPGCGKDCAEYKKAKIKRELEKRWLLKIARKRGANYSPALEKREHREFMKTKIKRG